MLHLLRKLFAPTKKSGRSCRRARLVLEAFEPRDVPSASPLFSMAHPMFNPGPSANISGPAHSPPGNSINSILHNPSPSSAVLTASLTGTTGTSGTATFTPGATSGTNTFALSVSGLTASTTYTVDVGTTSLGTFTTDATGAGTLSLSNLTTSVAIGSVVNVLDPTSTTVLSGTLDPGCTGVVHTQGAQLTATLTGATGTSGTATFTPGATSGTNTFALSVSGLTASTTYTVDVGTTSLGTFTTDATGAGTLSLSNLTTSITAGSAITVVDPSSATVLQGVFNQGGGCHHH